MKLCKSSIVFVSVAVMLLSSMAVSAESDSTGDVWHQTWSGSKWNWGASTDSKSNIDITDISYDISGTQATVTMTTVGAMSAGMEDDVVYTMHLKSAGSSYYMIVYTNSQGSVMGWGDYAGFMEQLDDPISGNTFTATFEVSNPDSDWQVYGFNVEYYEPGNEQGEAWWDYAPNSNAPWYTGGDGDGDSGNGGSSGSSGTPGFETITVIAAVGIALIILRRKK